MTWNMKMLRDCATFSSGGTPNKGKPEFWNGDIPWVSSGEMSKQFIDDTTLHISQAGAEIGSRIVPAGTIFAVVRGMSLASEFRVSYAMREMAFNQDVKALIVKPGLDPYFFFCSLRAHSEQIRSLATEAAHGTKKMEMERLESFCIPVPDLNIQQRAAAMVKAYDNLIETNRRRIALLEESARLLYREWFIQLRFPGHEQAQIVNGFPAGWSLQPLSALIEINPRTPFEKGKSYPFVPMQALSEASMLIGGHEERVISGGAKFRNLDTLLARITPCLENGKTGFVQFLSEDAPVASGSTEFIVMRSRTMSPYWVYCLARSEAFREHAIGSMAGSDGRQRVNPKCFDNFHALQAPASVLDSFDNAMQPVFAQVEVLAKTNQNLQLARDALLPRLMSGQLDASSLPLHAAVAS